MGKVVIYVSTATGFVLLPVGFFYLPDLTNQGLAMLAAGVLLILATLGYLATDRPRLVRAVIAAGLSLVLLLYAAAMGWRQMESLTEKDWQDYGRAERTPSLASKTDVAAYGFVRDASLIAAGVNGVLCLWILTRAMLGTRTGQTLRPK